MTIIHNLDFDPTNPVTNISSPRGAVSEPTFAAQSNRWCSLASDMIVERSCLEGSLPPRWEVRRVTDTPKGTVIAAILEHLGWADVIILTDGVIDGKLMSVRWTVGIRSPLVGLHVAVFIFIIMLNR